MMMIEHRKLLVEETELAVFGLLCSQLLTASPLPLEHVI
jgi:hypothetical protein